MGATNVRDSSFLSRRGDEDGITCRSARALRGWLTLAAWFAFALPCFAQQTTAPGTQVRNVAQISFEDQFGRPVTVETNPVTAVVEPTPTRSTIELLRVGAASEALVSTAGPTLCVAESGAIPLSAPVLADGASVDPLQPLTLVPTTSVHGGEAMFVHLVDGDQNRDASVVDTAQVELTSPIGDRETLRLSETGPNTGVFVGYVQTHVRGASAGNGGPSLFAQLESLSVPIAGRERIVAMNPSTRTISNELTEEMVEMRIEGITMRALVNLLYAIENRDPPMSVERVAVKRQYKDQTRVDATVVVARIRPQ